MFVLKLSAIQNTLFTEQIFNYIKRSYEKKVFIDNFDSSKGNLLYTVISTNLLKRVLKGL